MDALQTANLFFTVAVKGDDFPMYRDVLLLLFFRGKAPPPLDRTQAIHRTAKQVVAMTAPQAPSARFFFPGSAHITLACVPW